MEPGLQHKLLSERFITFSTANCFAPQFGSVLCWAAKMLLTFLSVIFFFKLYTRYVYYVYNSYRLSTYRLLHLNETQQQHTFCLLIYFVLSTLIMCVFLCCRLGFFSMNRYHFAFCLEQISIDQVHMFFLLVFFVLKCDKVVVLTFTGPCF